MKTYADDIVRLYRPSGEYRMLKPVASTISDINLEKAIERLYCAAPPGILRGDVKVLPREDGYVGIEFKSDVRLKGFLETDDHWLLPNNVHVSGRFARNSGQLVRNRCFRNYREYIGLDCCVQDWFDMIFRNQTSDIHYDGLNDLYWAAKHNQAARIVVRKIILDDFNVVIYGLWLLNSHETFRKCFRRHFWAEMHRLDFHKQLEMLRVVRSLDLEV